LLGYIKNILIFASSIQNNMTPFEKAQQDVLEGKATVPSVSYGTKQLDYFGYQLAVHKMNMGAMAIGMKCHGITFTQLKKYYGLKGRSAKECLPEIKQLFEDFKVKLAA